MVPIQIKVPLWLKRQVILDAGAGAQTLSEWVRAAIVARLRGQTGSSSATDGK